MIRINAYFIVVFLLLLKYLAGSTTTLSQTTSVNVGNIENNQGGAVSIHDAKGPINININPNQQHLSHQYEVIVSLSHLDHVLRFLYSSRIISELQMPFFTNDQGTQTPYDGHIIEHCVKINFEGQGCMLDNYDGDVTILWIKEHLSNCYAHFLSDGHLALQIESHLLKRKKTLEDIEALRCLFSYRGGEIFRIMNSLKNLSLTNPLYLSDQKYYKQLISNQMIVLLLMVELKKIKENPPQKEDASFLCCKKSAVDVKKPILNKESIQNYLISVYKEGKEILDKARRFWRDDHNGAAAICFQGCSILRPSLYQGRSVPNQPKSYLTDLYVKLHERSPVVIHGAGGMGKSTLIAQYVDESIKNKAYGLICWMNAENEKTLRKSLEDTIRKLDIRFNANDQDTAEILLHIIQEKCFEKNIHDINRLFIFDNAPSYRTIQALIPNTGHAIVTTRMNPNDPRYQSTPLDQVKAIKLSVFSSFEAKSYLHETFQSLLTGTYDKQLLESLCEDISQKLGCYPLALRLAAGYITNKDFTIKTIENYSKSLDQSTQLQEFINFSIKEEAEDLSNEEKKTITKSLVDSFSLTYNGLSQAEKDIFHAICYLQVDHIPTELFKNLDRFEDVIKILAKKNVISLDGTEMKSLSLHRLTQEVGRYIFEQTEEFKDNKQSFFTNLQQSLELYVLSVHEELKAHKSGSNPLTQEDIQEKHKILFDLKLSWLSLHHKAPREVLLIDKEAYFVRILQNKIGDAFLKMENPLSIEESLKNVILRQLQIDDETFINLRTIYDDHFSSITDLVQKKEIFIKLDKFYKGDFTKCVDWSFFKGIPYEQILDRLDVLISTHEEPSVNIDQMFQDANRFVAEGKDPFLSLFVSRYLQNKHGMKQRELLKFLDNVCFKNLDPSFHTYKQTLYAWASCSLRQRSFLETQKLNDVSIHHDVNGLLYLSQKTPDGRYVISDRHVDVLHKSLNHLTNYLRESGKTEIDGKEFFAFLTGLNSYIKILKIQTEIQTEIYNRVTTFMNEKLLAGNVTVFYALLEYSDITNDQLNQLFDVDVQKFLDCLKGFFEFYKYNEDFKNASIQKLKEIEEITRNTCTSEANKYVIHNTMEKVLCVSKESLSTFYNILEIEGMSLYDQVLILEWMSSNVGHLISLNSPTLETDLKETVSFLKNNYSASEICNVLSIPLKQDITYKDVLHRFKILHEKILSKTPLNDKDTKEWIAHYIGAIEQNHFDLLMNHPFLLPPLSVVPISMMIKIAAESTDEKWKLFIKNPLDSEMINILFDLSDSKKFIKDLEKL